MLFKDIKDLENNVQRKFFIEKINLIYRTIEEFCALKEYDLYKDELKEALYIEELIKIGIISSSSQISELKIFLKDDYYKLISALNYYAEHKEDTNYILDRFYNSFRKKEQLEAQNDKLSPTIADFFAGAGGLSLGFVEEGYRIKFANEIEDVCVETYKINHPDLPCDKIVSEDIRKLVYKIEDYIRELTIDVVIGGPPCQSFSAANQQRIIDDPRNELYKYFVKAVEKIKPKFIVMENVKGMLKVANQVVEDFNKLSVDIESNKVGYSMAYKIFNSCDFSVAQKRERLIYIGIRDDIKDKLGLTPEGVIEEIEGNNIGNKIFVLKDALDCIKVLDAPREKNMTEVDSESTGKKVAANLYYNDTNQYLDLINNGKKNPIIYNHKARYVSDVNYEIYDKLGQGEDSTSKKIEHVMPYKHRNHVFKDKYFKLFEDKPCRTITAHMKMDCHSHIHPTQVRSLTPREAARVQSFPDEYIFLGPYLKTYMQIGNAVPPLMARGFAKVIMKYLKLI